ncbi:CmcJ/NvfI family oxidoreductase [Streptomyces sp. NPDC047081]|uniref:CmcJ/NvfI family oxidoreductase n=1 Tax=Streptomyces sp. NPDC047081 TaxID=3154706 RepID=UPI0033E09C2E
MITTDINYALDVDGRPRFDIVDQERMNVRFAPVAVDVREARSINDTLDLEVNGFRLYDHRSAVAEHGTKAELEEHYFPEMCAFLRELTGAVDVRPHRSGLVVRSAEWKPTMDGFPPATFAHLDFTPKSHAEFVKLSERDDGPIPPYSRAVVYQTWRAISPPPQDSTLAFADPRSVPDSDLFVMDTVMGPEVFPSCFFESRLSRVNPDHRWYYFPDLRPDEVVVFKGHDSDPDRTGDVMHTAVHNPDAGPDAVPRRSIEARFIAFYA